MNINRLMIVVSLCLCMVCCPDLQGQDRKYTGYKDDSVTGFTGVKSKIQYQAPTAVGWQTNTWIGIDNVGKDCWLQIGWAVEKKPQVQNATYAEVSRADGTHNLYYLQVIEDNANYEIVKEGVRAYWKLNDAAFHEEPWADIVGKTDIKMITAQYQVEVFDNDTDYVPGSVKKKNCFDEIKYKIGDGSFQVAALATDFSDNPKGGVEVEKTVDKATMKVWDTRNVGSSGGGSSGHDLTYTDANSPISWKMGMITVTEEKQEEARQLVLNKLRASQDKPGIMTTEQGLYGDSHAFGAPESLKDILQIGVGIKPYPKGSSVVPFEFFIKPGEKVSLVSARTAVDDDSQWVKQSFNDIDWKKEMVRAGFKSKYIEGRLPKTQIDKVFAEVLKFKNVDLPDNGHLIFRYLELKPSKKLEKSQYFINKGDYWLVEVLGVHVKTLVSRRGEVLGYLTSLLILVDDETGKPVFVIAMH
jgi:hypothetical protein